LNPNPFPSAIEVIGYMSQRVKLELQIASTGFSFYVACAGSGSFDQQ
jgi:hypothetical protein